MELFICYQRIDKLRGITPKLRVEHLKLCLKKARNAKKEEKVKHIELILKDKSNKS